LYIYPNFIGHGADALNWPQVVELSNAGVDVESHTVHHPHLMHRSHPEMSDAEYASWLHAELAGSKAIIEARTHKPIRFLSYPYGDYDQTIEHEAAADGYVAALTSWAGFNTEKTKPLELRRIPIESDTTLDAFARGVGAVPLQLSGVSPAAETVATPAAVSATIVQHGELDPATVQIALLGESGAGSYDPATGRVTVTLRKPSRPRQQVIVYGQRLSDRRPMAAAWTFYTSTAAKSRYDAIAQRLHELPLHHTQAKRQ